MCLNSQKKDGRLLAMFLESARLHGCTHLSLHSLYESKMITTLSQLIAQVESANSIQALRFEPAFHPTTKNITACIAAHKPFGGMSYVTAEGLLAHSFGLYQIMGENIYDLGYSGTILDWWNSADKQLDTFTKFCTNKGINYSLGEIVNDATKRLNFAKKYNGSAMYADRMLVVYNSLQGK